MLNTLLAVSISIFSQGADVALNWLDKVIQTIISNLPMVGVGIIVFTLILKTITLPLDIYSKVVSRKQSLKMEDMRPQLEKLQKQYANNKELYNQKMMELYKKNNYSMFSACIPSIVMMIVFMVVFSSFNSYSQYANLSTYNEMINSYNASIYQNAITLTLNEDYYQVEKGAIITVDPTDSAYRIYKSSDESKFVYFTVASFQVSDKGIAKDATISYYIDTDRMMANATVSAQVKALQKEYASLETPVVLNDDEACAEFIKNEAREASAKTFTERQEGFFWIKNIWYADTTVAHPVRDYSSFVSSITKKVEVNGKNYRINEYEGSPYATDACYNEITKNLKTEKSSANGYYILIVLSIGSMFLSQFIMSKMQRAQTELQSADGSAASSMKTMMIMMPIIYGIFSFSYSSSFSIYMITSNIFGIITSILTTLIVDKVFTKKQRVAFLEKHEKKYNQTKGILEQGKNKKK